MRFACSRLTQPEFGAGSRVAVILSVCLGFVALTAAAADDPRRTPIVIAIEKVAPAVANISTEQIVTYRSFDPRWGNRYRPFDDFFEEFFRPYRLRQERKEMPLGSGVIIDEEGYIVTNEHVVHRASNLKVRLADESVHDAELISSDADNDLAIIKITTPKKFAAVKMGTSKDLMVGETVIAIGNPFGYGNSVTTGVLSAKKRDIAIPSEHGNVEYKDLLQTDALINPGNSGGPLINIHGELIGINTAIRGDAQGIGFAIPVDKVKERLAALFNFQKISKVWLGLEVDSRAASTEGLVIARVAPRSPAAAAGLATGDLITHVDGHKVAGELDYAKQMLKKDAGDTVSLTVVRAGRPLTCHVRLEKVEALAQQLAKDKLGLTLQNLSPDQAYQRRILIREGALLVTAVDSGGPAGGMRRDDIILSVLSYRVRNLDELGALLSQVEQDKVVDIIFVRGQDRWRATVRVR